MMQRLLLSLTISVQFVLLPGCSNADQPNAVGDAANQVAPASSDVDSIEGNWVVVSASKNGAIDEASLGDLGQFSRQSLTITSALGQYHFRIRRVPNMEPKQLDIVDERGRLAKAIYELDRDQLKICYAESIFQKRPPDSFTTVEGDRRVVLTMRRIAPGQPIGEKLLRPRMKPLNRFVGEWTETADVAQQKPPTSVYQWIADGRYLLALVQQVDSKETRQQIQISTFDFRQSTYRRWCFDSSGEVLEWNGAWDDPTETMTWTNGNSQQLEQFMGAKTFTWQRIANTDQAEPTASGKGECRFVRGEPRLELPTAEQGTQLIKEITHLGRYVGKWRLDTTRKSTDTNSEKPDRVDTCLQQWILDGHFVCSRSVATAAERTGEDAIQFWAYDATDHLYRHWFFGAWGNIAVFNGTWDETTKTFSWTLADSPLMNGTHRFVSDEMHQVRYVTTDRHGNTLSEISGEAVRTK